MTSSRYIALACVFLAVACEDDPGPLDSGSAGAAPTAGAAGSGNGGAGQPGGSAAGGNAGASNAGASNAGAGNAGAGNAGAGNAGAGAISGTSGYGGAGQPGGSAGQAPGGGGQGGAGQGGAGQGGAGQGGAGQGGTSGQGGAGQGGAGQGGTSGQGGAGQGGAGQGGTSGQGGGGAGGGPAGAGGGLPARPFDWIGLIGTGQSLSVGASTGPALDTQQPYDNRMLTDDGSKAALALLDPMNAALQLAPLVAPMRLQSIAAQQSPYPIYPENIYGETPGEGMANQLSALSLATEGRGYTTLYSAVGAGGRKLVELSKGGDAMAFEASLFEARAFARLAQEAGKSFGYGGVILTHGEGDHATADYGAGVYQLYVDYNTELRKITGQTGAIPLFLSQQSSHPGDASTAALSTLQQWQAGVDHPGEVFCVGPRYQYEYADVIKAAGVDFIDRIHMRAAGYRRLGEKHAEVYWRVVTLGEAWQPLQPLKVSRQGKIITLQLHVPDPPLSWDTHMFPPHSQPGATWAQWAKGKGFEVVQDNPATALTIDDVEIDGDQVLVTLASEPTGAEVFLSYALFQEPFEPNASGLQHAAGTPAGRHGLLRDSDPFVGRDAETITCLVNQGSPDIYPLYGGAGAFEARSLGDVVSAPGLPPDTVVVSKKAPVEGKNAAPDVLVLSSPWGGPTGQAKLHFAYQQRNYLVSFRLPVPSVP